MSPNNALWDTITETGLRDTPERDLRVLAGVRRSVGLRGLFFRPFPMHRAPIRCLCRVPPLRNPPSRCPRPLRGQLPMGSSPEFRGSGSAGRPTGLVFPRILAMPLRPLSTAWIVSSDLSIKGGLPLRSVPMVLVLVLLVLVYVQGVAVPGSGSSAHRTAFRA